MIIVWRSFLIVVLAQFLIGVPSLADSYIEKTDNRIISLEAETGKMLWQYKPAELSDASFKLYEEGIVVVPNLHEDTTKAFYLDTESGKLISPFNQNENQLLAQSPINWTYTYAVMENGWRLSRLYKPSKKRPIVFEDSEGKEVWRMKAKVNPKPIRIWRNMFFYCSEPQIAEAKLYAHRAGSKKVRWVVDLNRVRVSSGRSRGLRSVSFQIIEDAIYVGGNEYIFSLQPRTGKLLWYRNLAKDLGFSFGRFTNIVFSKSNNLLIVSSVYRVVAIDLESQQYLWHLKPDTFPQTPHPAIYGNQIILIAGEDWKLKTIKPNDTGT